MRFCVDASAVLAQVIADQRTSRVENFWAELSTSDEVFAPLIVLGECASVLRRRAFDGFMSHDEWQSLLSSVLRLPIELCPRREQFGLALDIAARTRRRRAYDMQYVAVAVLERCEMVTLDGGVYQAAREQRIGARLLR